MNYQFTGSQFQQHSDENIDPYLLGISEQQQSAASLNPSTASFEHDVETATRIPGFPAHQYAAELVTSRPTNSDVSGQALNPHAIPFRPAQVSAIASYPDQPWITPRTKSSREHQLSLLRQATTGRLSQQYRNVPVPSNWQINNRFAALNADPSTLQSYPYSDEQISARPCTPPEAITQSQWSNPYLTPSSITSSRFQASGSSAGQIPLTNGDRDLSWHPATPEFSPGNSAPSEDIESWNRDTYTLGDRVWTERAAPPTPTPSSRHGRRGSVTPSASTQPYTCDVCGKGFQQKYKLQHHFRYHGYRTECCGVCGKPFVFAKDLRRHIKTHNKAERHLFCNIAGCKYHTKGFQRLDHLKRHNTNQHPGNVLTPPSTSYGCG